MRGLGSGVRGLGGLGFKDLGFRDELIPQHQAQLPSCPSNRR